MIRIWQLLCLGCLAASLLYTVILLQHPCSTLVQKHSIVNSIDLSKYHEVPQHPDQHDSTSQSTHTAEKKTSEKTYHRTYTEQEKTEKIHSRRLSLNISVPTVRKPDIAKSIFISTREKLFPDDPDFQAYEIGDCINNGDSDMKKLSRNCGCPPEKNSSGLHRCCRLHMLMMMKEVYGEMIKANIPLILTGDAVQGWLHDKQLMPHALDISAGVPFLFWNSDLYLGVMKRLATRGYCIWFRSPDWMKIWSSVIPIDIRPWTFVGKEVYFAGNDDGNPYTMSSILPKKLAVLDGINVYLPNKPKEYVKKLYGEKKTSVIPPKDKLFPPDPNFINREEGSCKLNGASEYKNLSTNCGCPPVVVKSHDIHPCCRIHLIHLLKEIYAEMVPAKIPMIVTGGAVIGWYRNRELVPYDKDLDGGLEFKYWKNPKYLSCLDRLAKKGFCVWYRSPTWTKIWSTVVAFDLFAFNVVEGKKVFFDGPLENGPYDVSHILPVKTDVLEGVKVFLPNNPEKYMDQLYGKGKWEKPWY